MNKYCAHLYHTLAALKRDLPASLVAPLRTSEQTNLNSSNHTYTKSTPSHIHHNCAPLQHTHDTHHLFNFTHICTTLDLWTDPAGVMELLTRLPPQTRVRGVCGHNNLNLCISDLRIGMIRNKLKINDSKTEFIIITSSFF